MTEAGKHLAIRLSTLLPELDDAINSCRKQDDTSRVLHLGYARSPTAEFFDGVHDALAENFPDLEIVPHDEPVEECLKMIKKGSMDLALMVEPLNHDTRQIGFLPLVSYPLVCAMAKSHTFANRKSMPLKQLKHERLLIFSRTEIPQYVKDVRSLLKPNQLSFHKAREFDGIDQLLPAVSAGRGVALLLESAKFMCDRPIAWLPLKPSSRSKRIGVLYRNPPGSLTKKLLNLIQNTVCKCVNSRPPEKPEN